MKRYIKRTLAVVLCAAVLQFNVAAAPTYIAEQGSGEVLEDLLTQDLSVWAPLPTNASALQIKAKGAVLMEQTTGRVLFEQEAHARLPIASVTKIMTLLLVMEAIDSGRLHYDEMLTCSAYAASMGGSQIWLEEGESMSVDHLLKAVAVVSANDACVVFAEHLCGTAEAFVAQMNQRAAELGMTDTLFVDCSGLDDAGYSCAMDVALMSRQLMQNHPDVTRYTTIWTDSLRNGDSQLVNTNKLVRHYSGATGLKTGTTDAAGHCLAATAERDGLALISVVLGCATTDDRFSGARSLLDHGFANYAIYRAAPSDLLPDIVSVLHGESDGVRPVADTSQPLLIAKGGEKRLKQTLQLASDVEAPVTAGQILGKIVYTLDGKECGSCTVRAANGVARLGFGGALRRLIKALLG